MPCCSLQVLIQAVLTIVETIISECDQESPLLINFFTHLTPGQTEWTRIRQALPPQVRLLITQLFLHTNNEDL